jgi:hypothetical protein
MITRMLFATLVSAIVACGERGAGSVDRSGTDAADSISGRMGNMGGGHGSRAGMPSMAMMQVMRLHMDSMAALPPDQMQAMMATHQERASAMLDAMGADMRGMRMTSDPAWEALTDSVKRDLAELQGLSGKAAAGRMRGHHARMSRLMDAHENTLSAR